MTQTAKIVLVILSFNLEFLVLLPDSTGQEPSKVAVTNISVVDVVGGKINHGMTILIENEKIVRVERANQVKIPADAISIDGTNQFAIPGLWDMHIHWYQQKSMSLFPINGVTGVRVMWGNRLHHQWRKEFDDGTQLGPRMLIASSLVDGPDPIWPGSTIASNAEEGRQAVAKAREDNADFIKVYSLLPRDAYFAIAEEAKKQNLPFAGHVPRMVSAWEASDAGQHSMEHLYELMIACSSEEQQLRKLLQSHVEATGSIKESITNSEFSEEIVGRAYNTFDEQKAKLLARKFVENQTWQCPTMTVLRNLAFIDQPIVQDNPNLKYMPKGIRNLIAPSKDPRGRSKTELEKSKQQFIYQQKLLKLLHESGVPIIAGTDCLNPFCLPGFSIHTELELLVESGMKPMDALRSATINAARFQGKETDLGSIDAGKAADVVILTANPVENISNTQAIHTVIQRGKVLTPAKRSELLEEFEDQ